MKNKKTDRGFSLYEFQDRNGVTCSIQKSSIATEDAIWLGCNDIGLKIFLPGQSPAWQEIDPKEWFGAEYIANTRMHLTQDQVKTMLPILQKFVETGEI